MNRILTFLIVVFAFSFSSCVENKGSGNEVDVTVGDDNGLIKVESKIFSFPSPVQTAILLRKANTKFNADLLHPTSKGSTYTANYKKALNLGIYGSDLAYLTNFGNATKSAEYFKTVESIATDMGITSSMDPALLKRFYDNLNNRDSLYSLNSEFFMAVNAYLKDVNQEEQASLILTGGWLEALHLSIDAAETDMNVRRRVGEQKASLSSLLELLGSTADENVLALITDLKDIQETYNTIGQQYTFVLPIQDPENKTTHIRSKSMVEVSDDQLKLLKEKVAALRNKITA